MTPSRSQTLAPQVAVVIPNWNTAGHLRECLDAVRAQDLAGGLEILVVDNGSTDESLHYLRGEGIPYVALDRNIGFAGAVNLGAGKTSAPFLLSLNVDVTLRPGCLAALHRALAGDPTLGGVQPRILQAADGAEMEPSKIYSAGQYLTWAGTAFEYGEGEKDGARFNADREVFGVCGAVCLLRREMFAGLGGYDERYFAFYEDVDLNARARILGWRFAYVARAVAVHEAHASWRRVSVPADFNRRLLVCNRAATGIKVLPRRSLPMVGALVLRSTGGAIIRGMWKAAFIAPARLATWLPRLLAERRKLRGAQRGRSLDAWLGKPTARADAT